MRQLGERYPAYRWGQNVGYATSDHVAGLAAAGLTPHHRRSFLRPRQLTLDFDAGPDTTVEVDFVALADMLESGEPATRELPLPNDNALTAVPPHV
jgi:hypothetical protein